MSSDFSFWKDFGKQFNIIRGKYIILYLDDLVNEFENCFIVFKKTKSEVDFAMERILSENTQLNYGVHMIGTIRSYLEGANIFSKKIISTLVISKVEIHGETKTFTNELEPKINLICKEIIEICQELSRKSLLLLSKYLNAKAKKMKWDKELLDKARFPDINDIEYDVDQIYEIAELIKGKFQFMCLLFIKDYMCSEPDDEGLTEKLSVALAAMKSKLKTCEKLFTDKVNYMYPLLNQLNSENLDDLPQDIISAIQSLDAENSDSSSEEEEEDESENYEEEEDEDEEDSYSINEGEEN